MKESIKKLLQNYRKRIREITETLKEKYRPEKIILFGSCVSGRITSDSDIDMLIIKDTDKAYRERWMEIGRLVRNSKRNIPFEPFIITTKEFQRELKRNFFLQEIMEKGRVLYEKS